MLPAALNPACSPSFSDSPLAALHRPRRISCTTVETSWPPGGAPTSPRSPALSSLQAAATINASFTRHPSSPPLLRRSSLMTNFQVNDPALPAAGEMVTSSTGSPRSHRKSMDPQHTRQPSLGELHQKLEEEQEAQANRLLHMIRIQQDQLNALHKQAHSAQRPLHTPPESIGTSAIADTPGLPVQGNPFDHHAQTTRSASITALPHGHGVFARPSSLSHQSSRRVSNASPSSRTGSPCVHPSAGPLGPLTEDFLLGGTRDETAFYQAETMTLARENQMLRLRVKELERQISDLSAASPTERQAARTGSVCHSHSPLAEGSAVDASALGESAQT